MKPDVNLKNYLADHPKWVETSPNNWSHKGDERTSLQWDEYDALVKVPVRDQDELYHVKSQTIGDPDGAPPIEVMVTIFVEQYGREGTYQTSITSIGCEGVVHTVSIATILI